MLAWGQLVSNLKGELLLLNSILVKPAKTLCEIPAQRDRQDVDEAEERKGVEQHHSVRQEG